MILHPTRSINAISPRRDESIFGGTKRAPFAQRHRPTLYVCRRHTYSKNRYVNFTRKIFCGLVLNTLSNKLRGSGVFRSE